MLFRILCVISFIIAVSAEGYWEIRFKSGAALKDRDGNDCDKYIFPKNPCDPYMLVRVDEAEKATTRTVWDNESPNFDSTVTIGPISKDANIVIEMWDNDAKHSDDDLMSRWDNLRIQSLIGTHTLADRYNNIEITSTWRSI